MLSLREKYTYHQIHPLKLATDIIGCLVSSWLLWQHSLLLGLLVAFLPSVVMSIYMMLWVDFAQRKDSRFGRYVAHHMTHLAEAVRLAGQTVIWIGAWVHAPLAIAAGIAVIAFGWTYSLPRWLSAATPKQSMAIRNSDILDRRNVS